MFPHSPSNSPHLPEPPFQSLKSVTPPFTPLFGTSALGQSSPVEILMSVPPSTSPGSVPWFGVSVFASQLTNVTTLLAGKS